MDQTARVRRAMLDFNSGIGFYAHLDAEVGLEFPYGPTLGLPAQINGGKAVRRHLEMVQASGLTLSDVEVHAAGDGLLFAESTGLYRDAHGRPFRSPLIARIELRDGLISRIREYWNTKQIAEANQ